MLLSDSAPPTFKKVFIDNKKFLNTAAITAYAKREKLKNRILLMPVRLYMSAKELADMTLLNDVLKFNRIKFNGNAYMLPALYTVFETKTDD